MALVVVVLVTITTWVVVVVLVCMNILADTYMYHFAIQRYF